MEGLTFYWLTWSFWIIATFFMKKENKTRLKFSIWLLLFICASSWVIPIFGYEVSGAGIFLSCSLFYAAARMERLKMLYSLLCSFIIMLAYVCFYLFELFDPVWLIFPRNWMLAVIVVCISFLLQRNSWGRVYILLLGSIQGEFLYALILSKYSFPFLIASFTFLDVIALATLLVTIWNGIEYLATFYERHFNQLEREKQKLS